MKRLTALLLALACPSSAVTPLTPPLSEQCAAFWLGRDDFARQFTLLDRDPADLVDADTARAIAIAQGGGDAPRTDASIAFQRPLMTALLKAMIVDGDKQSREVHDRLVAACADLTAQDR